MNIFELFGCHLSKDAFSNFAKYSGSLIKRWLKDMLPALSGSIVKGGLLNSDKLAGLARSRWINNEQP
jgi:hypothetical protein